MDDWATSGRIKIERAKEHIAYLEAAFEAFLARHPYEVIPYDEDQTGDRVWRLSLRETVAPKWGAVAGDAIHNLRAALDILVYQLALSNTGKADSSIKFPISETPEYFETRDLPKVQTCGQVAVEIIKALKPFKGGNDPLWALHRMDIIDKHHVLIPVLTAIHHITIDPTVAIRKFIKETAGIDVAPMAMGIRPSATSRYPMEDGTELYRVLAAMRDKMDMNPQFTFAVAFDEGEVLQGEPIGPALHQFVDLVDGIVRQFGRILPSLQQT